MNSKTLPSTNSRWFRRCSRRLEKRRRCVSYRRFYVSLLGIKRQNRRLFGKWRDETHNLRSTKKRECWRKQRLKKKYFRKKTKGRDELVFESNCFLARLWNEISLIFLSFFSLFSPLSLSLSLSLASLCLSLCLLSTLFLLLLALDPSHFRVFFHLCSFSLFSTVWGTAWTVVTWIVRCILSLLLRWNATPLFECTFCQNHKTRREEERKRRKKRKEKKVLHGEGWSFEMNQHWWTSKATEMNASKLFLSARMIKESCIHYSHKYFY